VNANSIDTVDDRPILHRQREITDHWLFRSLLVAAAAEITARCPDYFRCSTVDCGRYEAIARAHASRAALRGLSSDDLATAMGLGIQTLDDLNITVELTDRQPDSISLMLMRSILDAYAACHAFFTLRLPEHPARGFPEEPWVRTTHGGARYAIARRHGKPLLVVSPLGMPLKLWGQLIDDTPFNRQCHIVESGAGSFITGGTPNPSSMERDLAAIEDVIEENDLTQIDVVCWSDAARTAIALASRQQQRLASLTLIAPTFHGTPRSESYLSPYEDGLRDLFATIGSDPPPTTFLFDGLVDAPVAQAALNLQCPKRRADAVLRLPPMDSLADLLSPLRDAASFNNYMNRIAADEPYDIAQTLGCIDIPILMVVGSHDAVINTSLSRAIMKTYGRNVTQATLYGAGHHPHLLQYNYLRHAMETFHAGAPPTSTARVRVEKLH
jgi:pimeloyl-ACP methyl ester carboxylesterase